MTEPRQGQADVIGRAMRDLQAARGGRDYRFDAGSPAVARAKAVLARAVGNSTHAERGLWARQENDRMFGPGRSRSGRPRA